MKIVKSELVSLGEFTQEYAEQIFNELLAFSGYGFTKSHAVVYSMFAAWQLYFKAYFMDEYMCVCLNAVDRSDSKKGVDLLDCRVKYAISQGIVLYPPDINKSGINWELQNGGIRAGISGIKGIGNEAEALLIGRPYKNLRDFLDKTGASKSKFEALLFAGCFDDFDERENTYNWYHEVYRKKKNVKEVDDSQLTFDLFDCDDSEDSFKNVKAFSKEELRDLEYEMNGFLIPKNIICKYVKLLEEDKKIKTIEQVKNGVIKYPLVLCQVEKPLIFTSKKGTNWCKLKVTDGRDDLDIMMNESTYKLKARYFATGNILVVPVAFSDDGDRNTCFLSDGKEEIKILEK